MKLSTTLLTLGFKQSLTNHTLFLKKVGKVFVTVLVYVDDIIIASNNNEEVAQLKTDLQQSFKLRDLGSLKYFLGLEIARSSSEIAVCQHKYTPELLQEPGLLACKPSTIPMEPSIKLCQDSDKPLLGNLFVYRRLVGILMYLTIRRLSIIYDDHMLCQFSSSPKLSHL